MIDMTKMPTAAMLDRASRSGQEEAMAHKKSEAFDPKAPWSSPCLSKAVQSWTAAKKEVLVELDCLTNKVQRSRDAAESDFAMVSASSGKGGQSESADYFAQRREEKRRSAASQLAAQEAKNAAEAVRQARETLRNIDNCFHAYAQAYLEGVWSVDPSLVDLVRAYEVPTAVVERSVTALMTDAADTQRLLMATGIALGFGGPGTHAALPETNPASDAGTQAIPINPIKKENENV